eukprot:TRINITY_DN2832_c0_g1_i1.p1 TRINITY_DN2832_c0_g1~~TRINITY_DN2832_c0_g1_i1.p1  ORF type:complete len:385 (-),score=59.09 TRINITY_DN2832_c0_g1_i1:72-1226(-)
MEPKARGGKPKKRNQPVVYRKKSEASTITTEDGFTGEPAEWFKDDDYYKQFVAPLEYKDSDYYFGSYSHFNIHEEMLKDTVRTRSYKMAFENNMDKIKDKIVLDVGCGTGILSIFAAKAGAKHVYAVDNADIAYYAKEIVRKNGLEEKITVIKGKIEDVELPCKHVDIIVSEWMGYFLLYESMMDCILYARDKWLAPDGIIMPDKARINIVGIEDSEYKNEKFGFWDQVYGVDMSCIKQVALAEPLVDKVYSDLAITSVCTIAEFDLHTVKKEELDFSKTYCLTAKKTDNIHAICGWFDIFFNNLKNPVKFTTSPFTKDTHWKQTVFYLREPILLNEGECVKGSIAVRKSKTNFRDLDIKYSFHYDGKNTSKHYLQMYKLKQFL